MEKHVEPSNRKPGFSLLGLPLLLEDIVEVLWEDVTFGVHLGDLDDLVELEQIHIVLI